MNDAFVMNILENRIRGEMSRIQRQPKGDQTEEYKKFGRALQALDNLESLSIANWRVTLDKAETTRTQEKYMQTHLENALKDIEDRYVSTHNSTPKTYTVEILLGEAKIELEQSYWKDHTKTAREKKSTLMIEKQKELSDAAERSKAETESLKKSAEDIDSRIEEYTSAVKNKNADNYIAGANSQASKYNNLRREAKSIQEFKEQVFLRNEIAKNKLEELGIKKERKPYTRKAKNIQTETQNTQGIDSIISNTNLQSEPSGEGSQERYSIAINKFYPEKERIDKKYDLSLEDAMKQAEEDYKNKAGTKQYRTIQVRRRISEEKYEDVDKKEWIQYAKNFLHRQI